MNNLFLYASILRGQYIQKFQLASQTINDSCFYHSPEAPKDTYFLTMNDMTGDQFQRALLNGTFSNNISNVSLQLNLDAQFPNGLYSLNYTVIVQQNFSIHIIVPLSQLIVGGYVANKDGYFPSVQMNLQNAPPIVFNPTNQYMAVISIHMIPGLFNQTLVGVIKSAPNLLPLDNVKVSVNYLIVENQTTVPNAASGLTNTSGIYNISLQVPAKQLVFTILYDLPGYESVQQTLKTNYDTTNPQQLNYVSTLQPITMNPILNLYTATFQGSIIGPTGDPTQNINVTATLSPGSYQTSMLTDKKGIWSFTDRQLLNSSYNVSIEFQNAANKIQQSTFAVTIKTNNSVITGPTVYYQDYINAEIDGKLTRITKKKKLIEPVQIPVTIALKCNGTENDTTITSTGSYQFKFRYLIYYQQIIICQIDVEPNTFIFGQIKNVTLKPPNYKSELDFQITMVPQNKTKIYKTKLQGQLIDSSGFLTYIVGANVTFNLNPKDNLTQQLYVLTNSTGWYSFMFMSINQTYNLTTSIQYNNQFLPLQTTYQIIVNKSKSYTRNYNLTRINTTTIINSVLNNQLNKPIQGAQVSVTSYSPLMSAFPNNLKEKNVTDQFGKFTLLFQGYLYQNYTIFTSVLMQGGQSFQLDPLTINCSSTAVSIPPLVLSTKIKTVLEGSIVNALNVGEANLTVKCLTFNLQNKTNSSGVYVFVADTDPNNNYDVQFSYVDKQGKQNTFSQNITSQQIKSGNSISITPVFCESKVTAMVDGKMGSKGFMAADQPFKVGVDGQKMQSESTDPTGKFNCSFELIAKMNETYKILLSIDADERYNAEQFTETIVPPNFQIQNLNIKLNETPGFKSEIKRLYDHVYIIGETVTTYNCSIDPIRPVGEVNLELKMFNGQSYVDTNLGTVSREDGFFEIEVQLQKSSLSNQYVIIFTKPGIFTQEIYFEPLLTISRRQHKKVVDIGDVMLMLLNPGQCPPQETQYFQHLIELGLA